MNNKITEEIMEISKLSITLGVIGFLIILYSFINLQNPFFMITGVFGGLVFFFLAYDYWWKNLIDKKLKNLTYRVDSIVFQKNEK